MAENSGKSTSGTTKINETLSKLVIAMAKGAYGYNPKIASDAVSKIATDLDAIGYPIDKDTIRNRLKQAAIDCGVFEN